MDHQLRCDWADSVLGQCEDERGHVGPHMMTGLRFFREQPQTYAEGYRAGRIAALREVGCCRRYDDGPCAEAVPQSIAYWCNRCRLLAEAESGEDTDMHDLTDEQRQVFGKLEAES